MAGVTVSNAEALRQTVAEGGGVIIFKQVCNIKC
ncbi:hypothetical protein [Okeania sp. SIO3I5]|nr:hypothetical protein [Okeania sp. SIO3I5]